MGIEEDLEEYRANHSVRNSAPAALPAALKAFRSELAKAEKILAAAGVEPIPMLTDDLNGRHEWLGQSGYPMDGGSIVLSGSRLYAGSVNMFRKPAGIAVHSNLPFLTRKKARLAKHDTYLLVRGLLQERAYMLASFDWKSGSTTETWAKGDLLLYKSDFSENLERADGWLVRSVAGLTSR
jgi:hypothetical protein